MFMLKGLNRCLAALLVLVTLAPRAQTSLPAPDVPFSGHVGRTFRESDPAKYPAQRQAPKGAPNIVLILLDDVGFGQFSTFGGGVPSPSMDKLAATGVSYNRFHTSGICSPTRAAMLTGRTPHNAGFGLVGELATGYDGYKGFIPRSTATVAEVLRQSGYATAMFGKNHNTPNWEGGPTGPFEHWPTGMGFDYFYGFNGWGTSQWQPMLVENTRPVPPSNDPNYHLNTDLADRAISWVRQSKSVEPTKPFLLYMATGATHAPHHAPKEWIAKFKGQFDMGWDAYREVTFERQKKLGVVPADAQLTPRPSNLPAWKDLSPEKQRVMARQMEVFAAFGAHTDHELGRMLDAIKTLPDADNTLVMYVVGDNGASAEGGPEGEVNEIIAAVNGFPHEPPMTPAVVDKLGGPAYNNHFSAAWAWAMNTPFQYYKQAVSHLGAIRNPLIVSWPRRIQADKAVRPQFHHVVDIAPTLLEAAGVQAPTMVNGIAQKPIDGVSMLYSFGDASAADRRKSLYFEVLSNRGVYDRGWFASARMPTEPWDSDRSRLDPDKVTWELYDLHKDFSQSKDLAAEQPLRLRQMQELWWSLAGSNSVLPLDWRGGERLIGEQRPNPARGVNHFVYYPGMVGLPEAIAPNTHNRSWSVSAQGQFTPSQKGMLITQGGMTGGWALYVHEGRVVFDYNLAQVAHYRIRADRPLPAKAGLIEARVRYEGKGPRDVGAGAEVTLLVDGKLVGQGRLPKTVRGIYSVNDGLDVGTDLGSPVSPDQPFPFPFTGALESVSLVLQ